MVLIWVPACDQLTNYYKQVHTKAQQGNGFLRTKNKELSNCVPEQTKDRQADE